MGSDHSPKVLVVEDEGIVLIDLELSLEDLGFDVVGSASELQNGISLARELALDIAVLDLNLAGKDSGPIADVLAERGIPFVFATGYTRSTIPQRHAGRPALAKPFSSHLLGDTLRSAMKSARKPG